MKKRAFSQLILLLPLIVSRLNCEDPEMLRRRFDVLGGTIRMVTLGGGGQPDWSGTTNRIAYVYRDQIWSIDPDGEKEQQMTDLPGRIRLPRWRPGRGDLAFVYEDPDGRIGINLLSGERMTEVIGDLHPIADITWSADGERLFFHQNGLAEGIEHITAHGSDLRSVNNPNGWGRIISVRAFYDSPDLLYVELRASVYNLWRIPQAGGEPVRLTEYSADDPVGSVMSHSAPSHDGQRLAVLSSQEHPYQDLMLHLMPASGGTMVQLIDLNAGIPAYPVWSPDDREIALQLTTHVTEVWVLELK